MHAIDHLRMGAVSSASIKCAGSHVGVSIGEDESSQMAVEDIAIFRLFSFFSYFPAVQNVYISATV